MDLEVPSAASSTSSVQFPRQTAHSLQCRTLCVYGPGSIRERCNYSVYTYLPLGIQVSTTILSGLKFDQPAEMPT
jgi:hypothetical protein